MQSMPVRRNEKRQLISENVEPNTGTVMDGASPSTLYYYSSLPELYAVSYGESLYVLGASALDLLLNRIAPNAYRVLRLSTSILGCSRRRT